MLAFLTPRRRASLWLLTAAVVTACATYVDQLTPPPDGSGDSGGSGESGGTDAGTAGSAGTASGGTPTGGVPGTAGSAGSSTTAGSESGMAGEGGAMGGAESGGTSAGGTTAAGTGGRGGTGGTAGKGGSGGTAGGGAGGKGGTGGTSGSGGSGGATQNCATNPIPAKTSWTATASSSQTGTPGSPPKQAIDGDTATRWSSGKDQANDWFQVDFGVKVTLSKVTLMLGTNTKDYPRKYAVRLSDTANDMNAQVLVSGMGAEATDTVITFPTKATGRYLLITQSGTASMLWWSIAELQAECAN